MKVILKKNFPDVSNLLIKYFHSDNYEWTVPRVYENKFIVHKCPIYVQYKERLVLNECLKDLNFQKVFPPQLAYQELMMYFGSALAAPEKTIPSIDDKTMLMAKGFDKYSFRKDKQKV